VNRGLPLPASSAVIAIPVPSNVRLPSLRRGTNREQRTSPSRRNRLRCDQTISEGKRNVRAFRLSCAARFWCSNHRFDPNRLRSISYGEH